MNFSQLETLLEILLSFIQIIIWPTIILIIALALRAPVQKLLNDLIEFNIKAGPIETTAKRQQQVIEIGTSLGAAVAHHFRDVEQDNRPQLDSEKTKAIAKAVEQLVTPRATRQLEGSSVLWVDDRPINNTYERQALETLGMQFTISKSTEDAIERLKRKPYDVILSDMARPPDQEAGYKLLEKIREMHLTTPFIIYAGSRRPEHIAEGRRRGAFGTTNDPQELFELVIKALNNSSLAQ